MYSSAVFAGVNLCTQILPGHGRPPPTILGIRKLETHGLPDGEDGIGLPLRSLVLAQYQSVTDRQTDGFAVAYTALAKLCFAERCKNVVKYFTALSGPRCCLLYVDVVIETPRASRFGCFVDDMYIGCIIHADDRSYILLYSLSFRVVLLS